MSTEISIEEIILSEFLQNSLPDSSVASEEGEAFSSNSDPQPQSSSMSDETTMTTVSSDDPQVSADSSSSRSPITSPPSEDVDPVHHNQDFDNEEEGHSHHLVYASLSLVLPEQEEYTSGAEILSFSAFNYSDSSATSSSSTPDLQGDWVDYSVVVQGSLVNRTKEKLQKSRKNARRTSYSTSRSYRLPRLKGHDQDTLNPDELSSECVKARGTKSKANRYECEACKKTFARRADVPRHMRSACPVIGKKHLLCEGCGKKYSRPDAVQRHRRTGDCDESMFAPKQGRKG